MNEHSFTIANDKISGAIALLKEKLKTGKNEQEKAIARAMISALEGRLSNLSPAVASFPIYHKED